MDIEVLEGSSLYSFFLAPLPVAPDSWLFWPTARQPQAHHHRLCCELREDSQGEGTAFHRLQHQPRRVHSSSWVCLPFLEPWLVHLHQCQNSLSFSWSSNSLFWTLLPQSFSPLCPIPIRNPYSVYSVTLLPWTDFTETLPPSAVIPDSKTDALYPSHFCKTQLQMQTSGDCI